MEGTDFNDISMYFYITYVIFETPWVVAVQKWGPGRVLAIAIISWSAITLGTGFVNSYSQTIACRVLLGAAEAGLIPALMFVISAVYPARSQGKRIAVLYITIAISGAVGGLFAYGVQSMGARHGLSAWRWLFIVEGLVSFALGFACWLSLPTTPETAWFLNEEEKLFMKRIREQGNPEKEGHSLRWSEFKMALTDPFVYLAAISLFCSSIAMFGFGTFLPTLLKGLGFVISLSFFRCHLPFSCLSANPDHRYTGLAPNYLSIPVYVLASITTAITTFVSDRYQRRALCLIHSPILVMIGYAVTLATDNKSAGFAAMFIVGAGVYSFNTVLAT